MHGVDVRRVHRHYELVRLRRLQPISQDAFLQPRRRPFPVTSAWLITFASARRVLDERDSALVADHRIRAVWSQVTGFKPFWFSSDILCHELEVVE